MTRGCASKLTGSVGRLKKSGRLTVSLSVPVRSVIRSSRLTAWTTCSGPTATPGSGGSPEVGELGVWASPGNPVCAAGPSAFVVASAGRGATAATFGPLPFAVPPFVGPPDAPDVPSCGSVATGRFVGFFAANRRTLTDPRTCDVLDPSVSRGRCLDPAIGSAGRELTPASWPREGAAKAPPLKLAAMTKEAMTDAPLRSTERPGPMLIP